VRSRLGELLVRAGLIDERDRRRAVAAHERSGDRLGAVLVRLGLTTEEQIAGALAEQLGFTYLDIAGHPLEPEIVRIIPRELAERAACIAVGVEDDSLVVAMADPLLFSLVQELEAYAGRRVREVVATQTGILAAIESAYSEQTNAEEREGFSRAHASEREGFSRAGASEREGFSRAGGSEREGFSRAHDSDRAVADILKLVAESDAIDVHVEPTADALLVRARLDGAMRTVASHPLAAHEEIVARLKLKAGLDVSERLLPQAGRMEVDGDGEIAVRVTTLRTANGEKVAIRPIDRRKPAPAVEDLGLSMSALETVRRALDGSDGLVLVSGPRGSGRTMTTAALLAALAAAGRSVVAVTPVTEYEIPGVIQVPTDEAVGLSAARAIATAIGQDADVIAVDGLHDRPTAEAALAAAVSGRMIIAAVAGVDATDALRKTAGLVSDPAVLYASARVVIAQRLVRRLCTACRRPAAAPAEDRQLPDVAGAASPSFEAVGCDQCDFTGYRGRVGLFEVAAVTDDMRRLLESDAPIDAIRAAAGAAGATLADAARGLLEQGITTPEQVRRAVPDLPEGRSVCGQCGAPVSSGYSACPHCGALLGGACVHCGRALQPGWNFCPFCARAAEPAARPRGTTRGIMRLVRNQDGSDPV
jgi:type IV pilus assembly protein PilB